MCKAKYLCTPFITRVIIAWLFLLYAGVEAAAQTEMSDVGNFYPLLETYAARQNSHLSFLATDRKNLEQWRKEARAKLSELLAFTLPPALLATQFLDTVKREGYTQYLVRYNTNAFQQTEAFLLVPDKLTKPAPAVIALHDHGGFYFYGKEKHTLTDNRPQILVDYIQTLYEGRTYADELAKRGYVVLCPDVIYFGSQKLDLNKIPDQTRQNFPDLLSTDEATSINAFNKFAGAQETIMAKTILTAGTTWLGMILQSDRAAIDFLLSRPEVDPQKIACMGLSLGGLRSTYLFGMDSRIKAGIIAAFSTTYRHMLQEYVRHTWMMYVPRQYQYLDLPDVASLNAPRPLLVLNCKQDKLFHPEGMKAAEKKLSDIYTRMKAKEKFTCNYYDVPHSLTITMQEDAFTWLEKWLR